MSNEVYAFALKTALNEIQNACPDVTTNFIFKHDKLIAQDKNTEEETATQTIEAFNNINEKADTIGGMEAVTIQSAEGKIKIATINDFNLATVSTNEADEKYVNTLTRILIPLVIKLVDQIQPASTTNETAANPQPEPEPEKYEPYYPTEKAFEATNYEATEEPVYETTNETEYTQNYNPYEPEEETTTTEKEEEQTEPEPTELEATYEMLPETPATQLIVENLGGLLVPSDTVRIDTEVIAQWNQLYGTNKTNEVQVEALNGKTTRCKFKPIKKSKNAGKGVIKIPEKIQLTLETAEGELVTVKPIV